MGKIPWIGVHGLATACNKCSKQITAPITQSFSGLQDLTGATQQASREASSR